MLLYLLMGMSVLGVQPNLAINGNFGDGLKGWQSSGSDISTEAATVDGRTVAHIGVPAQAQPGFPGLFQEWLTARDRASAHACLRLNTHTGRPLVSDTWLSKLEVLVGRRLRPLPVALCAKADRKP